MSIFFEIQVIVALLTSSKNGALQIQDQTGKLDCIVTPSSVGSLPFSYSDELSNNTLKPNASDKIIRILNFLVVIELNDSRSPKAFEETRNLPSSILKLYVVVGANDITYLHTFRRESILASTLTSKDKLNTFSTSSDVLPLTFKECDTSQQNLNVTLMNVENHAPNGDSVRRIALEVLGISKFPVRCKYNGEYSFSLYGLTPDLNTHDSSRQSVNLQTRDPDCEVLNVFCKNGQTSKAFKTVGISKLGSFWISFEGKSVLYRILPRF